MLRNFFYGCCCCCVFQLMGHLPARAEGSSWLLLYSSSVHGYSLRTLYRQMLGVDSPILLILMDTQHHVRATADLVSSQDLLSRNCRQRWYCHEKFLTCRLQSKDKCFRIHGQPQRRGQEFATGDVCNVVLI